jgi:uncharacterized lipoprotein YmbA
MLVALAGLAAACSQTPSPTLYTLVPRSGVRVERPLGGVALRTVEVAHYLNRPQIVRHGDPFILKADEFDRWAESLDTMITRVLVQDLTTRLPGAQVSAASSPVTGKSDWTIAIDVARFDADPGNTVVLIAHWSIRKGSADTPVHLEEITVPAGSDSSSDLAAAMSNCLGQLSDRIAQAFGAAA